MTSKVDFKCVNVKFYLFCKAAAKPAPVKKAPPAAAAEESSSEESSSEDDAPPSKKPKAGVFLKFY